METLYTCTHCKRAGFTLKGLSAHRCRALGRGTLSKAEISDVVRANKVGKAGGSR